MKNLSMTLLWILAIYLAKEQAGLNWASIVFTFSVGAVIAAVIQDALDERRTYFKKHFEIGLSGKTIKKLEELGIDQKEYVTLLEEASLNIIKNLTKN